MNIFGDKFDIQLVVHQPKSMARFYRKSTGPIRRLWSTTGGSSIIDHQLTRILQSICWKIVFGLTDRQINTHTGITTCRLNRLRVSLVIKNKYCQYYFSVWPTIISYFFRILKIRILNFHQLGPLGRVGHRVAMSVCVCVCHKSCNYR